MRRFFIWLLAVALAGTLAGGLAVAWYYQRIKAPWPMADQCVADVADASVPLDVDQSHYASIIAGLSVRRGLAPRAATIALATVYQSPGSVTSTTATATHSACSSNVPRRGGAPRSR